MMKAKKVLVLHIGMHKTATTAIQDSLKGFTDGTTRYARVGWPNPNHSVAFHTLFSHSGKPHKLLHEKGVGVRKLKELKATYQTELEQDLTSDEENLVVSGEDISLLSAEELADMKAFFDPYCERIRVIAYVRDPVSFRSSNFQQAVKGGTSIFSVPQPGYRNRFQKFIDIFGAEATEFALFDSAGFPDGSIIADFCQRIGIAAQAISEQTSNEALSTEAVGLLFLWNRMGLNSVGSPRKKRARMKLIREVRINFPGKFKFSAALGQKNLDTEDISWMEALGGFSLMKPAAKGEAGIDSEADLVACAGQTVPKLQEVLANKGLESPSEDPVELLNLMYAFHLGVVATKGAS